MGAVKTSLKPVSEAIYFLLVICTFLLLLSWCFLNSRIFRDLQTGKACSGSLCKCTCRGASVLTSQGGRVDIRWFKQRLVERLQPRRTFLGKSSLFPLREQLLKLSSNQVQLFERPRIFSLALSRSPHFVKLSRPFPRSLCMVVRSTTTSTLWYRIWASCESGQTLLCRKPSFFRTMTRPQR